MSLWEISIALVSITTGPLSLALGMLHMGIAQDTRWRIEIHYRRKPVVKQLGSYSSHK